MFRTKDFLFFLITIGFLFVVSPVRAELFSGTTALDISKGDSFDFSADERNPDQGADLSVGLGEDGNPVFLPPTVIKDMGEVSLEEVREAPPKGDYSEGGTVKKSHTYCIVTKENHYVKFLVDENSVETMKLIIRWVYQSDGSRELNSRAGVITSTTWGKIKALFR